MGNITTNLDTYLDILDFNEDEIAVNIIGIGFQIVLDLLKDTIPKSDRRWQPEIKRWIINKRHLDALKSLEQKLESGDIPLTIESVENEIKIKRIADIFSLPISLRLKAKWVAENLISDDPKIKKEYSIVSQEWAVYNEEENKWYYETGRYTFDSPVELDENKRQQAAENLQRVRDYAPLRSLIDWGNAYQFKQMLLEETNWRCSICHSGEKRIEVQGGKEVKTRTNLEMHRIVPGSQEGEYTKENVIIVCSKCHKRVEGKTRSEIEEYSNLEYPISSEEDEYYEEYYKSCYPSDF